MDLYLTSPVPPFASVLGTAANTFTTRQDISPAPAPVISANQLHIGSKIDIECDGEFSTTGSPNLTLGFYIGAAPTTITTVIAESAVIAAATGAAAFPWHMEWRGMVTALGTSGSVTGNGYLDLGTALTTSSRSPIPITLALRTFTWDTTIPRQIGVCATWGTSSASNSIRVYSHRVLLMN